MKTSIDLPSVRLAAIRAAIVLTPSYGMAYLTDKMVYVVPTLAAAGFFAASIGVENIQAERRVEDETDTDANSASYDGNLDYE